MPMLRSSVPAAAALAMLAGLAACDMATTPPTPVAAVRIVNATGAEVDVYVDNFAAIPRLPNGVVSGGLILPAGLHQVQFTRPNGDSVIADTPVTLPANAVRTAVAFAGPGTGVMATTLPDTGAIVPEGRTKLRVSNFSQRTIRIYRTQPDFPDSVAIMTPFPYGATSPYLQSTPGDWQVLVVDSAGARLTATAALPVPANERRTVIVLDSAGVVRTRVLPE